MTINAYPLSWPDGWKRTPEPRRERAKFRARQTRTRQHGDGSSSSWTQKRDLTIADGVERVRQQLDLMRVSDDYVISTNLELRLDGLPRSNQRAPSDPGVAVYWKDGDATRCMAIDRYDRVQDNLAAIAATLDAMRAIERHGGAEILDRAFTGFAALPPPEDSDRGWWVVLGVKRDASAEDIKTAYRRLASANHPDRGGDAERMAEVTRAYQQALGA